MSLRVFSAKKIKTVISSQVWQQPIIKTKEKFDRLLAENEQAFQAAYKEPKITQPVNSAFTAKQAA
jgi:hypothetical protein